MSHAFGGSSANVGEAIRINPRRHSEPAKQKRMHRKHDIEEVLYTYINGIIFVTEAIYTMALVEFLRCFKGDKIMQKNILATDTVEFI